jgi:hypothetical protein
VFWKDIHGQHATNENQILSAVMDGQATKELITSSMKSGKCGAGIKEPAQENRLPLILLFCHGLIYCR